MEANGHFGSPEVKHYKLCSHIYQEVKHLLYEIWISQYVDIQYWVYYKKLRTMLFWGGKGQFVSPKV